MADIITFKGVQIFNSGAGGIGWNFSPGAFTDQIIDKAPPIGVGHFSLAGNINPAEHSLTLQLELSAASGFRATLNGLINFSRGTLSIPAEGNFDFCRLISFSPIERQRSEGGYIIQSTLTFWQYP